MPLHLGIPICSYIDSLIEGGITQDYIMDNRKMYPVADCCMISSYENVKKLIENGYKCIHDGYEASEINIISEACDKEMCKDSSETSSGCVIEQLAKELDEISDEQRCKKISDDLFDMAKSGYIDTEETFLFLKVYAQKFYRLFLNRGKNILWLFLRYRSTELVKDFVEYASDEAKEDFKRKTSSSEYVQHVLKHEIAKMRITPDNIIDFVNVIEALKDYFNTFTNEMICDITGALWVMYFRAEFYDKSIEIFEQFIDYKESDIEKVEEKAEAVFSNYMPDQYNIGGLIKFLTDMCDFLCDDIFGADEENMIDSVDTYVFDDIKYIAKRLNKNIIITNGYINDVCVCTCKGCAEYPEKCNALNNYNSWIHENAEYVNC